MNVTTEKYINEAKEIILSDDIDALEEIWDSISDVIRSRSKAISYDLIFRDCYLFSINQKKIQSVKWLEDQYQTLDPIIQNKLRQTMTYAKYIKNTKNI